jgi:hypothetical protein
MPRGGRRVGAGRKPKRPGIVLNMAGARVSATAPMLGPAPAVPTESAALLDPPAGLTQVQQDRWRQLAPYAIAQLTLVEATRPGFAELCEQLVMKEQIAAAINAAGAAHEGMDRLLRQYVKLTQRLDASLARFRLTGSGKAEAAAQRKPAANPWTAVIGT